MAIIRNRFYSRDNSLVWGEYNALPLTVLDADGVPLQTDINGCLKVVAGGGGPGGVALELPFTPTSTNQTLAVTNMDANIVLVAAGKWVLWADVPVVLHVGAAAVAPTPAASGNISVPAWTVVRWDLTAGLVMHAITSIAGDIGVLYAMWVMA